MDIVVRHLPTVSYDDGLALMLDLHERRAQEMIPDHLLILEHHPVVTRGWRLHGKPLPRERELEERGIAVRDADRGGLLTYHGPGQIVVYFIIKLADYFDGVSGLVTFIEDELIGFLSDYGLVGRRDAVHPGVWVGEKKIAAIGLRVAQGVTRHGLSLNVMNDLAVYGMFDPCGLTGDTMTNLKVLLDRSVTPAEFVSCGQRLAADIERSLDRRRAIRERRIA